MSSSDSDDARTREWTIYVCPMCGFMDPSQYTRQEDRPSYCIFASRGLSRNGQLLHPYYNDGKDEGWNPEVEYVPVVVVPKDA